MDILFHELSGHISHIHMIRNRKTAFLSLFFDIFISFSLVCVGGFQDSFLYFRERVSVRAEGGAEVEGDGKNLR